MAIVSMHRGPITRYSPHSANPLMLKLLIKSAEGSKIHKFMEGLLKHDLYRLRYGFEPRTLPLWRDALNLASLQRRYKRPGFL